MVNNLFSTTITSIKDISISAGVLLILDTSYSTRMGYHRNYQMYILYLYDFGT